MSRQPTCHPTTKGHAALTHRCKDDADFASSALGMGMMMGLTVVTGGAVFVTTGACDVGPTMMIVRVIVWVLTAVAARDIPCQYKGQVYGSTAPYM